MKRLITLLSGVVGAGLLLAGLSVSAQTLTFLDMSVLPGIQTAAPGDNLPWDIQLTNNNADTAYFVFTGFSDGLGATPDVTIPVYNLTPFGQQFTLAPNDSVTVTGMFQTNISLSAANTIYNSTAEVTYDLYDGSTFTNPVLTGAAADADWTLQVQSRQGPSGVPEPGAFGVLLGIGAATFGTLVRRRRR